MRRVIPSILRQVDPMIAFLVCVSGLFFYLFVRYYWKFQLAINPHYLSVYTPDELFPVKTGESRGEFQSQIARGFEHMKQSKVLICGLVRNVEKNVPLIIRRVEEMVKHFGDYRVLIVENNSSDRTRELLLEWNKVNPKVLILGCGRNSPGTCHISFAKVPTTAHIVSRGRISKMTHLRNIYLDELKSMWNSGEFRPDYTMMWDLDVVGSAYVDGVAHTMGYYADPDFRERTSSVCANGMYDWGIIKTYYDTYAHLDKNETFDMVRFIARDHFLNAFKNYKRGEPLKEVNACFSGLTIYNTSHLLPPEVRYDMDPDEDVHIECEHVRLSEKLPGKKWVNPSMIHLVMKNP